MASNEQAVLFRLQLTGAEQVAAGAATAETAIKRVGGAQEEAAAKSEGLNRNVFKLRSVLAMVSKDAAMLGIGVDGLANSLGGASKSALGLMSVLGIGTGAGLATAGLLVGMTLLSKAFEEDRKKAEELEERNKKLEDSYRNLGSAIEAATKHLNEMEFAKKRATGDLSEAEFLGTRVNFSQQIKDLEKQRDKLLAPFKTVGAKMGLINEEDIAAQREAVAKVDALNAKIANLRQQAISEYNAYKSRKAEADRQENMPSIDWKGDDVTKEKSGGPRWDIDKAYKDNESKIAKIDAMLDAAEEKRQVEESSMMLRQRERDIALLEKNKNDAIRIHDESVKAQMRADEDLAEKRKGWAEDERRIYEQNKAVQISAAVSAASMVATTASRSLQDIVKGKKLESGAVVEAIGDGLYADGVANVLKAAAMAWIPGLNVAAAPGLAAAGAAEIAAGLAMGGVGSGMSGGSQATAKEDERKEREKENERITKEHQQQVRQAQMDAYRQRDQYQNQGSGGSNTITINVSTINPSAETGRAIYDSMRQASNQDSSLGITKDLLRP